MDGRMPAQLPDEPRRDEPDIDAAALRNYAFHFLLLVASGLVYVVAAEDALALFLFWNIFLVIFLASFVLDMLPAVARIAALVAAALRGYLLGNRALLLF